MAYPVHPWQHPVHQLRREMDRLLNGFAGATTESPLAGQGELPVNVWENGDALFVETELPGVKAEQLDLAVVGSELTLKVQRPETDELGNTYHRRERPVGPLSRVLHLPAEIDANQVQADLHDGVLRVTLPKAAQARPRKIRVSGGE